MMQMSDHILKFILKQPPLRNPKGLIFFQSKILAESVNKPHNNMASNMKTDIIAIIINEQRISTSEITEIQNLNNFNQEIAS